MYVYIGKKVFMGFGIVCSFRPPQGGSQYVSSTDKGGITTVLSWSHLSVFITLPHSVLPEPTWPLQVNSFVWFHLPWTTLKNFISPSNTTLQDRQFWIVLDWSLWWILNAPEYPLSFEFLTGLVSCLLTHSCFDVWYSYIPSACIYVLGGKNLSVICFYPFCLSLHI